MFKANTLRIVERCNAANVAFRAHVKTLKSIAAARHYAPRGSAITVSTLAEAEYFAQAGYRDVLYAVGITTNKLPRLCELQQQGVTITACIDSLQMLDTISPLLDIFTHPLSLAIEIDCDGCRAGLRPSSQELLLIAEQLSQHSKIDFWGVMTHAGGSYACFTDEQKWQMATQEVTAATEAAERIRQRGIAVKNVSVGSTPTVLQAVSLEGVTELRAGVFATFDCVMADLGVCSYEDIALSVVTRVIGKREQEGIVLIDAGWMALSRDYLEHGVDGKPIGYGLVCDERNTILPGWYVAKTNQEHGLIQHIDGANADTSMFKHNTVLRILPVHACATASQFSEYWVMDDDARIVESWQRISGW